MKILINIVIRGNQKIRTVAMFFQTEFLVDSKTSTLFANPMVAPKL